MSSLDHLREDAAPLPRLDVVERRRIAVLTAATLVLATGIVLAVSEALPFLAPWVLPAVLTVLTVAFLAFGRRAASVGATTGARAWAGWAGATATFAVSGLVNLAGLGGALVAVLLVVVAVNAAIALWFRSPVHFAVVQVLGLGWGALAHVFGILPVAVLVVAVAGLWWLRRVGASRVVVVTTTIALPVAVAFLVHPLTHVSATVDAADVAVLTGSAAVALTAMALVTRRPGVSTVWSTARATALTVLIAQVVLGATPAVAGALHADEPWPSLLVAVAAVLCCGAVTLLRTTRRGIGTVLVLAGVQLGEVAAATALGPVTGTIVGLGGLTVVVVVTLVRGAGRAAPLLWTALLALPVLVALVLALPTLAVAGVLVVTGGTVAVLRVVRR